VSDEPLVAIVGRPNVGKSTLLNRLFGKRVAIVEERPGVTRDRKEVAVEWAGRRFRLVDTGGWLAAGDTLDQKVSAQSERAMLDADLLLVVVDVAVGVAEEDARVAETVRGTGRPALLVVNKVDDPAREAMIWDFLALGLGDPHPVSALHGRGAADILDELVARLPDAPAVAGDEVDDASDDEDDARVVDTSVALVGRPNVGKSTLFNRLIGEERSVVHDVPGTTRDSIDTIVDTEVGPIRFVDTAGMRRRARIDEGTEYYSLVRALRAVDEADIALLVVDSTVGVTHQDQRLAERVDAAGCPIVVLLNKWELLDAEERAEVRGQVEDRLHFLGDVPVLQLSAKSGQGVPRLLPVLGGTMDDYRRRVPTTQVNRVLRDAQARQPAPEGARVLYAIQGATEPPTFTLFTNRELPKHYLRYLERSLRDAFELGATPLKLRVRRR
jgi:GTP-binding protein